MITKDLGAVTAYAYAKEKGYTGTEAEFAELMASYATVAEQASQSAQTATEKAQQASASATSASQSATTATAKASEAQQSAQTATTKAQEASQSASESAQSAQTAVQAKQDAQTAKTASETAQASAESARDDAESARDEAQQYAESIDPQKLIGAYPVDTATGAIASFSDGADDIPMKSVKVAIEPVQSGSGDPSPDNVRPISGWTGAQVARTGKNLFYFDSTKVTTGETTAGTIRAYYPLEVSNCTLSFSAELINSGSTTTSNINIGKLKDGILSILDGFISQDGIIERTFTFSENEQAVLMTASSSPQSITPNFPKYRICVTTGSTPQAYEPYTGDTYSITFPTEAGTVYGGELDVTNGVLTVDRAMVDLGTLSYSRYDSDNKRWSTTIIDKKSTNNRSAKLWSDRWKATTQVATGDEGVMFGYLQNVYFYTSDSNNTPTGQLVYELATPITYTLTPIEIKSLLGDNNLWADTGNSTVTYRADTTMYINRKIAEAVSALS